MTEQFSIAIVGGGPAGALAAEQLASGGKRVVLFDEKLAWEKPCGGGLTHKALAQYPFLAEAGTDARFIRHCELISPLGRRAEFELRQPLAIFSRLTLNGLLLERARRAGAEIRKSRVVEVSRDGGRWRVATADAEVTAAFLVLAAGARNSLRNALAAPLAPADLMVTAGYFIPGEQATVRIQFLQGLSGYIWVFPRPGHVSAGIAARMGETSTVSLRQHLERWLEANGFSLEGARFYSHILPALGAETLDQLSVQGDGWMMTGDSAGLVDPITGEGLYYALRSAELCAGALLSEQLSTYERRLQEEIVEELRLAAGVAQRFYSGRIFGESVIEKMIALTQQSEGIRDLMSDLFAGTQGYRGLRTRVLRIVPGLVLSGISGALGLAGPSAAPSETPL